MALRRAIRPAAVAAVVALVLACPHHGTGASRVHFDFVDACLDLQPAENKHCLPSITYLDSQAACHHPVFFPLANPDARLEAIAGDVIVEETGLRVPFQYDCLPWQPSHAYHAAVPSRNVRCDVQSMLRKRGMTRTVVDLPIVDEEYSEMIAIYQAALRARDSFVMIELGARWGTWGSRAVAYLRRFNPDVFQHHLLYVEPDAVAAAGLRSVQAMNGITNYTLVEGKADAASIMAWANKHDKVDVLDMDIQGAELYLLPNLGDLLLNKVRRVIVGTHSNATHARMVQLISNKWGWTVRSETPFSKDTTCVKQFLRLGTNLSEIVRRGCFSETPFGKVAQWDGEIVADNPRFGSEAHSKACLVRKRHW